MPARSERLYLFPDEEGQPGRVMAFPIWWDRREFFKTYGHREIDVGGPIYEDDALLLAQWEASAWDKRCREQFTSDPRSQLPSVMAEMHRLESALSQTRWVIVESYEWESGLD